jgi:hypothetical protein
MNRWTNVYPWHGDDAKTEPLIAPEPYNPIPVPIPKPLAEVLINGVTWASNGYFTAHLTDLGTIHVLTFGSMEYCANDIDDLQNYLQDLYNERLRDDFETYINIAKFYSVKDPVWTETEAI